MNGRNNAARILVALGAMVLIAAALLHCIAAYPKVLSVSTWSFFVIMVSPIPWWYLA